MRIEAHPSFNKNVTFGAARNDTKDRNGVESCGMSLMAAVSRTMSFIRPYLIRLGYEVLNGKPGMA